MRNLGVMAIFLLLALLAAVAWISNFPDSAPVRWAAEWPLAGPWIAKAREAYLRPADSARPEAGEPEIEYIYIGPDGGERAEPADASELAEWAGARPLVWLRPGMEIRTAPGDGAEVVASVEIYGNVSLYERRGDWVEVLYDGTRGWVRSPEVLRGPPLGSEPAAVLPVPGRAPDPGELRRALAPLPVTEPVGRLGGYELYSDVADGELLAWLDRVASDVERAYVERYGVTPIDEPREAVVLYASQADFESLRNSLPVHEGRVSGLAGNGFVALSGEGGGKTELAATLIHELTHLLNRRALGPALPPWLDEGIARDLGSSVLGADGRLHPDLIGGLALQEGNEIRWRGAQAALVRLRRLSLRQALPGLEGLLGLDREAFYATPSQELHYDQSGFLVRYLLDSGDPRLAAGLRGFLAGISKGGPATGAALADALDVAWVDLDDGFGAWLASQKPRGPLPGAEISG